MGTLLDRIHSFVWGAPALVLIIGIGFYISVKTGWVQFWLLPQAFRTAQHQFARRREPDSGYRALCTALAATVGTGNLAGVAGAIALGGPGSIFWMWLCGLLGMATKFAEAALAVNYQEKTAQGYYVGGPMYMMKNGLGHQWIPLGKIYCVMGIIASFGIGNAAQVSAIAGSISHLFQTENTPYFRLALGLILSGLLLIMLRGTDRIGKITEKLVPFGTVFYIIMALGILLFRADRIGNAIEKIVRGAFCPQAVTGGMLGSGFTALRIGASRGVFTNEAGMGTASIAHGGARVNHPVQQGMMGILEVFIDTLLICTLTALAILCSGIPVPYGQDLGISITLNAYAAVYGSWAGVGVSFCTVLFAFATILGWGVYGAECVHFLANQSFIRPFLILQALAVIPVALLDNSASWEIAEITNGLMLVPNLICLTLLSNKLCLLVKQWKKGRKRGNPEIYFQNNLDL